MTGNFETDHPSYIATMLFICACAVLLNILVIAIIYKITYFRTSVDIFLTNLAVSDILQAGMVLPIHFRMLALHEEDFPGGNAACKVIQFIPLFIVVAAISTMIAIAADRYRVMLYRKTLFRRESVIIVGIVWLVSCCMSAPQLYEYSIYSETNEEKNKSQIVCGSDGIIEHFETVYVVITFVLAYCIPLLILLVCYTRISILVWRHAKQFRLADSDAPDSNSAAVQSNNQLATRISKRKVRVLKLVVSISVSFILLWTPYFILFAVNEMSNSDQSTDVEKWPHTVSRTMTILATFTDPTIFLYFNESFRTYLAKIFRCKHAQSNEEREHTKTSASDKTRGPGIPWSFLPNNRRIEPAESHIKQNSKLTVTDTEADL